MVFVFLFTSLIMKEPTSVYCSFMYSMYPLQNAIHSFSSWQKLVCMPTRKLSHCSAQSDVSGE